MLKNMINFLISFRPLVAKKSRKPNGILRGIQCHLIGVHNSFVERKNLQAQSDHIHNLYDEYLKNASMLCSNGQFTTSTTIVFDAVWRSYFQT